ncbi:hypothetical protein F4779DRAFT_602639 [Xylariaceae sp. FL0662B]|nr:hypothetical protein F4779DRAFT_602639 [Xylariaceae sp. FL0662B]
MARPKRTRGASTRSAAKAASPVPVPVPAEPAEETSSDLYDVSDREKEKAEQRRKSTRETTSAHTRPTLSQQKALMSQRQRRDSAMERLQNITSTTGNGASESMGESEASVELGRRGTPTPVHGRMTDVSGLDLDDDAFDDLETTIDLAGPASAQRSTDTSTLSTSHFRRRARAGSFLSRDDGPIRPSSRTGPNTPAFSSTFNIGLFKKRAREPSILGTAQKPRPQRPEPERESEHEEDEADDEFAPEAESTPLRRSKRHSKGAGPDRVSPQALPSAKTRKRKSEESHERRPRTSPFEENERIEGAAQQSHSDISSPPSLPREYDRPVTPVMNGEFMAPPLSSGSSSSDQEIWPPLQSLARRARRPASGLRRTPVRDGNVSEMSSPPSLTYSPNYPEPSPPPKQAAKSKRRAASKPETKVTTAVLTGLLPRRRHKHGRGDLFDVEDESDAEVDISGLGADEDELSYVNARTRRRPARPGSRSGPTNQSKSRGRSGQRGKAKQTPGSNKPAVRTYGRRSDEENQGDDSEEDDGSMGPAGAEQSEENSELMVARMGSELKSAKRKFQEVDKWELRYEEMTQSSSPFRGGR